MQQKTIHIPNMSCEHCVRTIKSELSDLDFVQKVDISLDNKQATIYYSSEDKWNQIVAVLDEINYPPAL